LGYTVDDITKIRASVNDLHQLATIYSGAAALAVAKDFTTFGKYLWGTGL